MEVPSFFEKMFGKIPPYLVAVFLAFWCVVIVVAGRLGVHIPEDHVIWLVYLFSFCISFIIFIFIVALARWCLAKWRKGDAQKLERGAQENPYTKRIQK